jgi:hypothetical protein
MSQAVSNELLDQELQLVPRAPVDLNLLPEVSQEPQPAEEPSNPRSELARVDEVLREKEEFVRNAFLFLQDDIYPANSKVGHALSRFKDKFRKRCAPFRIFRQGDSDAFVRIDPKNPGQPPRRVVWGEERFKVVQALHEGEGHYGGVNKTRAKVADRYWFPQLTKFVNEFVKTCDVCQKERVGAAPRDDREIFPTPPTAPWFRTHVDLCGPFEESGPQKYRCIAVAVDSVTKFVEVRPLRGTKAKGVDSEEVADFLQTEVLHRYPGVYEVVTDRGGEFGAKFTLLCKAWGIKHVKIAAKNPKANGQVERYMRVIKPALRKCAHEHPGEWHKHVTEWGRLQFASSPTGNY